MHCVLLGVYASLFNRHLQLLTSSDKQELENLVQEISAPIELVSHGRQPRRPSEKAQFRANEYLNYLMFFSPILFKKFLQNNQVHYSNLLRLSFSTRLLLTTSNPTSVDYAEQFLNDFCENATAVFGNEKCHTINLHSLRHLTHQVRIFGPLFVTSAMSFESAHCFLGKFATGSHDFCEIICRRYLESQSLINEDVEDDDFVELVEDWAGKNLTAEARTRNYCNLVKNTVLVTEAKRKFAGSTILSRHQNGSFFFDSVCYERNEKAPNGFVWFQKNSEVFYGHVQYFINFPGSTEVFAYLKLLKLLSSFLSEIPTLKLPFFLQVESTQQKEFVLANSLKKMACIETKNEIWLTSVPKFLDHK